MPAPAVYVLAIVGTVGAVLAFKEFVYEPHIAPAIDRWKHEYQAARRRREAAAHSSEGDLLMSQTDSPIAESSGSNKAPDGGDDSDDDRPLSELGKGFKGSTSKYLKGSLLTRRPERGTPPSQDPADVELDDFVAREVSKWRNEDTTQVLRQRKNASEHAMDESIHAIPYTPLSPSRTHVVFDPSLPSTPGSGSRTASLPHSPLLPQSRSVEITSGVEVTQDEESSIPKTQDEPVKQIASPKSPTLAPPGSPRVFPTPPINQAISPPPQVSPFQHTITQSSFFANATVTTPTSSVSSITRNNVSVSAHPLQESYTVPSLSQSYPQDLDYEHGLELLSPPSSRSESPFSMANLSPELGPDRTQGLRALSPFGTTNSNLSTSNFSSAVSSPSPLRMGLGNESFDAVSPILEPQRVSQPVSPFPAVPSPLVHQNPSVTNSARSTAYLSFPDDSEDESHVQTRPPANLGASVKMGANSPVSHSRPQVLRQQSQTSPMPSPQLHRDSLSGSRSLHNSRTGRIGTYAAPGPAQDQFLAPSQNTEQGLGLFPIPPQAPANVVYSPSPSESATASPLGHAHQHHGHSNPGLHAPGMQRAQSDGELSDLDLMSDYAPSESDFGNESDSSWSMAGESAAASPRLDAVNAPNFVNVTRGGTIREARGSGRFGER